MRASQELFKINELEFLVKDLNQADSKGKQLYKKLMENKFSDDKNLRPRFLILVQIPPFLEQYTTFMVTSAVKSTFNRHLNWLVAKMGIRKGTVAESILIDYIRYLLLSVDSNSLMPQPGTKKSEVIHRWYILGWLIKFFKSEIYRSLAKQALFFDWLYYKGDQQQFRIFEPTWLMIVNSLNKYKEMSEELLEFLFLYAKE